MNRIPRANRFLSLAFTLFAATALTASEPADSLADAAQAGDQARVRQLIKLKAGPESRQPDGTTALHWAVRHENLEMVRLLLRAGAGASPTNLYGVAPLSLACAAGNGPITELLLQAGADPNTTLRGGETALMTAARAGRIEPVNALLRAGAAVNAREHRSQTALMWAAAEGHAGVVERLIQAGADFRTPLSDSGYAPIHFAAREGRIESARALIRAGADVNEPMRPEKPGGKNVVKGTSPLVLAVENGHFDLAAMLLESGADPNDQRSGFAPLHVLSWVRKPNRGDGDDGDPPPIGSGRLSSLQFVRKLVSHGADVNLRLKAGRSGKGILTRKGATPFLMAALTADLPFLRLLKELGADPGMPNAENCTPLMAAAGVGTLAPTEEAGTEPEVLATVEYLLSLGADINAVDANGETAMHGAAYKNLPLVVNLLAAKGARAAIWHQKNKHGWSPVIIAEGFRVGNFKPSPETLEALHKALIREGIQPPPPTPRTADLKGY